jgi:glutamate synthase domain-containing protein 2
MESPEPTKGTTYTPEVNAEIQEKAETGRFRVARSGRSRNMPTFDDLSLIPCSLSRVPLEAFYEQCTTTTTLGARFAAKPLELSTPITIAGMGAKLLSPAVRVALALGAAHAGILYTTGHGGMLTEEREHAQLLSYEVLPSRIGFNPRHLIQADVIELVSVRGVSPSIGMPFHNHRDSQMMARAEQETAYSRLSHSPTRHPDWVGPDDLPTKVEELREATDWQVPIIVKISAAHVYDDVQLAAKAGADIVTVEGMEAAASTGPAILNEHTGVPGMAAVCQARRALQDLGLEDEVNLILCGGIRSGADVAKALALGADAVSIGTAALVSLEPWPQQSAEASRRDGAGGASNESGSGESALAASNSEAQTLWPGLEDAALHLANFIGSLTQEIQLLARACGKANVHDLEAEDLRALSLEASLITNVPLVGMDTVIGR